MTDADVSPITELLRLVKTGDAGAKERLFQVLHLELRKMAVRRLRNERPDHTLQPTALVNEAYLRLAAGEDRGFANRGHFLATASEVMRHVLIDYARRRMARMEGQARMPLDVTIPAARGEWPEQILAFNASLTRLKEMDPRCARVLELRLFGGMTFDELAVETGQSSRNAKRDFKHGSAWVMADLGLTLPPEASPRRRAGRAAAMGEDDQRGDASDA